LAFDGKKNRKKTSLAKGAFDTDETADGIQKPFDDGQPKTGPGDVSGLFVLDPVKPIKNLVQVFICNSESIIPNGYTGIDSRHIDRYLYFPAVLGVVDGIGDQVSEDTFQGNGICGEYGEGIFWEVQCKGLVLFLGRGTQKVYDIFKELLQADRLGLLANNSFFDARQIEEISNQ
jgi:hypothetical protein